MTGKKVTLQLQTTVVATVMPPLQHIQSIHTSTAHINNLSQLAELHGEKLPHHYSWHQPYTTCVLSQCKNQPQLDLMLPLTLMDKVKHTQDAAVNKSTQRKDASWLQEFLTFCEGLGIRKSDALPAREDILIAWAASYAGCLAGRTVGAKLLVIRKEHERHGLAWLGGDHRILKGVEELRPAPSFHSKRALITISMLEDLNKGLSRSSGLDICIRTICLLSFFCQLRSSEILSPTQDLAKFNPWWHATFAHIAESMAENGACNLHLPWSKTQKARGDDVWIPCQEAPLDPIHAIHKHLIKNRLNIDHPIAAHHDAHDNVITLTRSKFVCCINRILRAMNKEYPHITGHCFWIGGTTFYLVSGVPLDMVKKFGRWHSQAFLEYWHCLDYLGAIHIEMLPLKPQAGQKHVRSSPKAWHPSTGESPSWLRCALGLLLMWVSIVMLSAHPWSTRMEFEDIVLFCSHRFQIPNSTKSLPLPVSLVCLPRFRSVSFLAVTTTSMSQSNPYVIPVQNTGDVAFPFVICTKGHSVENSKWWEYFCWLMFIFPSLSSATTTMTTITTGSTMTMVVTTTGNGNWSLRHICVLSPRYVFCSSLTC